MKRQLASLLTVLCVVALGRAQDLKLPADWEYYPLRAGATWEYQATGGKKFSIKVSGLEKKGTDVCARLLGIDSSNKETSEDVTIKADGVYRCAYNDNVLDPTLRFVKLPLKLGEEWDIEARLFNSPLKGKGKIADKEEMVKVPAGDYNCIRCDTTLETNNFKFLVTYYFAKDVGIVKQVLDTNGQQVTLELTKYSPAK